MHVCSEDSLWSFGLSLCYMDPKDQTHVIRLESKCLYPLSCLAVADFLIKTECDLPLGPTILIHELILSLDLLCILELWNSVSPLPWIRTVLFSPLGLRSLILIFQFR